MIRPWVPGDRRLVVDSWLQSFSWSAWAGAMDARTYWEVYPPIVDAILDRASVVVCCNPEDVDQVLGWACHEGQTLHYLHVKQVFRDTVEEQPNVALQLLESLGMTAGRRFIFTFRTRDWDRFRSRHFLNGKHMPRQAHKAKD